MKRGEISVSAYTYKADGSRNDRMEVYTSDYSLMAKFDRYCKENPEHWKVMETMTQGGDIVGKRYQCTWECVHFRAKPVKRELTEEQRAALSERAKAQFKNAAK